MQPVNLDERSRPSWPDLPPATPQQCEDQSLAGRLPAPARAGAGRAAPSTRPTSQALRLPPAPSHRAPIFASRLVSRADRRPPASPARHLGDLPRVHLSFHLSSLRPEGLLASPPASPQITSRPIRTSRRQFRRPPPAPRPYSRSSASGPGPLRARPLGGRSHALPQIRPGRPRRSRTLLAFSSPHPPTQ